MNIQKKYFYKLLVLCMFFSIEAKDTKKVDSKVLSQLEAAKEPILSPEEQLKTFQLPEGFAIELVTSEVQGTNKPLSINFDTSGRLWITTAQLYPIDLSKRHNTPEQLKAAKLLWDSPGNDKVIIVDKPYEKGPHRGRVFLDGLVIPMGVLPHKNGAYVFHRDKLLFVHDKNGDDKADDQEILLQGFGRQDSHTMAHNLMHYPGKQIFFSQGALCRGTVVDKNGKKTPLNKGSHVSLDEDGQNISFIAAGLGNMWGWHLDRDGQLWGQGANNFGNAVTPIFQGTQFTWSSHFPYGKQPGTNNSLDLKGTGLSGLARSEGSNGFPEKWQEYFFVANAITHRISSLKVTKDKKRKI